MTLNHEQLTLNHEQQMTCYRALRAHRDQLVREARADPGARAAIAMELADIDKLIVELEENLVANRREQGMRKTMVKTSMDLAAAEKCYACDDRATGLRDRRPEGGQLERACPRHADPSLVVLTVCQLCLGPVRRGSLLVDGHYVHRTCHTEASES